MTYIAIIHWLISKSKFSIQEVRKRRSFKRSLPLIYTSCGSPYSGEYCLAAACVGRGVMVMGGALAGGP